MKQMRLLAMALVLTAATLAGCGCTNQRTESTSAPTVLPTNEENWTSTGSTAATAESTKSTTAATQSTTSATETQSSTAASTGAAGESTAESGMDETTEAARNAHRPRG